MPFKFCPECGASLEPGARFCGSCGQPLGRNAATSRAPLAGIVTLVTLLALGGGFWLHLRLAPEAPRPLKPGERPPGVPAAAAGQGAPSGHPPLELPQDIKDYMASLQEEAEQHPEDAKRWKTLAGVYYRASRIDSSYAGKAAAAYEHLLELDENDVDGLRGLGNLAYDRQDRKKAIEYYERLLTLDPTNAEVRTDLGTMYFQEGKPERAIAEYERVIAATPNFYQAHFNLAVVHDAQGDRAAAHAALEKARDLTTEPQVKERIDTLLRVARNENLSLSDAARALADRAAAADTAASSSSGPPARPPGPAASFEEEVERIFRAHRIAGPKVVRVEWPEAGRARVVMANFPMDQMPEAMKSSYLGKMAAGIRDAESRFSVDTPLVVELVDEKSGRVMATVNAREKAP